MSVTVVRQGSPLPLSLTLEDGATTRYPLARLYAQDGTLLGTHSLTHRAFGLYTNDSVVMTSDDFVSVVYIVYDDAAHTVESPNHLRASDIFAQPDALHADDVIDGSVTVSAVLARANAAAAGKIVRTLGNRYTYRNADDTADLFTLIDNDTERTPV